MKNEIIIIGAGGHVTSVLNLLKYTEYTVIGIYDNSYQEGKNELINAIPVKGRIDSIPSRYQILLSIGDNHERRRLFHRFSNQILADNLIHELSFIEDHIEMGIANQILANSYLNANTVIGNNNIINSSSTIEHEVRIGSHNHISVNTTICGRVTIGDSCFIGAGTVIIDKINICSDVTIGAGSVVIRSIEEPGVYVGNPLRKIK